MMDLCKIIWKLRHILVNLFQFYRFPMPRSHGMGRVEIVQEVALIDFPSCRAGFMRLCMWFIFISLWSLLKKVLP